MEITVRTEKDVPVVALKGKFDTHNSPEVERHLTSLIDEGEKRVLVNLAQVDYISSAGLRVLLSTAKKLQTNGGELRICAMNEFVSEVFEMSGFSTIFAVFENEADALRDS